MIAFQNTLNTIISKIIVVVAIMIITIVFITTSLWSLEYQKFTLKNGINVYTFKTQNPIVTYAIAYNVGSMDEDSNQEGIAHYLEHTMFLGTNRYSKKRYSDEIKEMGAYYNAFTSYDITLYYTSLPYTYLESAMKIEADRMRWLVIDKDLVTNEKKVINEERNMNNNRPYNKFYHILRRAVFPNTNYGKTVIGDYRIFQKITPEDLRNFYEKWYRPNNANIFIIGDIDFAKVEEYINKYYAKLSNSIDIPTRNNYLENAYQANYVIEYKNDRIKQNVLVKSFMVPSLVSDKSTHSKDAYSLILIADMLQSQANILYKNLVLDKKLVVDISINYDISTKGNTDFSIILIPNQNISEKVIFNELNRTLNQIARRGFTKQDIANSNRKIKDKLELLQEDDVEYLFTIARYINAGIKVEDIFSISNQLMAVSQRDINKYYRKLLKQHYVVVKALKQ